MFRPYSVFIGVRYAAAKRRSQLVSFISMISMLGMTVGVALLIVVLSVMNGFDREMRQRILGLVPHITIKSYSDQQDWQQVGSIAKNHPEVKAVAPFVQLNGMLLKGSDVEGVLIYGIEPKQESQVSIIQHYVEPPALNSLANGGHILLGLPLAQRLGISQGQTINLMVPAQTDSGRVKPRFKAFTVAAIFNTGTELDQSVALIGIDDASALAAQQGKGLRVLLSNTFDAPRIAWEIDQNLPYGYISRDWTRSHGNLYSAIQLSKRLVGLMLLTIIAVAAFNVVSALVMIVTDKRADIAILRTLGASPVGIMTTFMVQGSLIGVIGTAVGVVLGVLLSLSITDLVAWLEQLSGHQFLSSDVYPVNYLPVEIRVNDIAMVAGTAVLMSLVATLYPAWRAATIQPAEALRYE